MSTFTLCLKTRFGTLGTLTYMWTFYNNLISNMIKFKLYKNYLISKIFPTTLKKKNKYKQGN